MGRRPNPAIVGIDPVHPNEATRECSRRRSRNPTGGSPRNRTELKGSGLGLKCHCFSDTGHRCHRSNKRRMRPGGVPRIPPYLPELMIFEYPHGLEFGMRNHGRYIAVCISTWRWLQLPSHPSRPIIGRMQEHPGRTGSSFTQEPHAVGALGQKLGPIHGMCRGYPISPPMPRDPTVGRMSNPGYSSTVGDPSPSHLSTRP